MKNPYLLYITMFFIAFAFTPKSYANDLFFAPKRIQLTDGQPITELRVTNTSDIARSYAVAIEDVIMTEDGITSRVDGFDYSARRMVRFVPRQFEISPGKQQIIRIMARVASDTPDGEYHSHLEFLENVSRRAALNPKSDENNRASANAQVSYSTSIPLTISKGNINTVLDISDIKITTNDTGKKFISLDINRSGNGQGNAILDIDYISPNGSITKIGGRRNIYVYREIDRRAYQTPLSLPNGKAIEQGARVKVTLFNKDRLDDGPVKELMLSTL